MGNLLMTTTMTEAFGTVLMQTQTDAVELITRGLSIGLAIMDTILAITIDVKAFKRFTKQFQQYMAGGFISARLLFSRGDLTVIDLHSGVPDSGGSLLVTYRAIDALLEHTNVISNFPMDMSYFKKRKWGRFFYIPTDKIMIKSLLAFTEWNHIHEGRRAKRARTVVIIDEAEVKFNSRTFSSPDRMEWIFFFADHRHFNYDSWLATQSNRMVDHQVQDLIQTKFKYRATTGFGIEGKPVSFLFGDLFHAAPYDRASRTKSLLPQFYRLYKRKAKVYDTIHMFDGVATAGKLEGGKKNAVSTEGQTAFD